MFEASTCFRCENCDVKKQFCKKYNDRCYSLIAVGVFLPECKPKDRVPVMRIKGVNC